MGREVLLGIIENCIDSIEKEKCQRRGKWDYPKGESITGVKSCSKHEHETSPLLERRRTCSTDALTNAQPDHSEVAQNSSRSVD